MIIPTQLNENTTKNSNAKSQHAAARLHYLREYQRVKNGLMRDPKNQLQARRETAIAKFSSVGFPTLKHSDWKYTSLIPLLQLPFSLSSASSHLDTELAATLAPSHYRLVFVNGRFSQTLSHRIALPHHAIISHVADVIEHNPDHLFRHWETSAECVENSFIRLNTAFMQDGAYIYLPANTQIVSPIELVFISTCEQGFIPIRNIIITEKNSYAVVIEKYISLEKVAPCYFNNSVTECFLAAESHVEHYTCLEESENAMHIGNLLVEQQEKSQFSAYSLALTGALLRSDVRVKLCHAQAQCHLKGLYYAQNKQHIDHQTVIDHVSPQTHSKEFYKGIIDDHARAVFNGKLIMREKAIKSSAQQLNKNLLLSTTAEVMTKPQLEIFVDDIQCTHGANIGQLDETALFYLRARGLNKKEAHTLLVKAFIHEIIQQMPLLSTYSAASLSLKKILAFDYANI